MGKGMSVKTTAKIWGGEGKGGGKGKGGGRGRVLA